MTTKPADEPKSMPLEKHFGKFTCKTLKYELGITTVEEALQHSDEILESLKQQP